MSDKELTPVDRFVSLKELHTALEESIKASKASIELSTELRDYCRQAVDSSMLAIADIPKLREDFQKHVESVDSKIERLKMVQVWMPTITVSIVCLVKILFLR
jgi:hypothetical protein